jgi:hypothetical protein
LAVSFSSNTTHSSVFGGGVMRARCHDFIG